MRLSCDPTDPGYHPQKGTTREFYVGIFLDGREVDPKRTVVITADEERGFLRVRRFNQSTRAMEDNIIIGQVHIDVPDDIRVAAPKLPAPICDASYGFVDSAIVYFVGETEGFRHQLTFDRGRSRWIAQPVYVTA